MTTLVLEFKKIESKDKTKYDNCYSSSKAEIIINKSHIITNIPKSLGKGSGWIIDSVINHTISIWKYNPLAGSKYIKLPKELDNPRKDLINIQNTDENQCFKCYLAWYLNPVGCNPRRITKAEKDFANRPVSGYENKEQYPIYVSTQCCEEKHVNLLMIEEKEKKALCSYQRFQYIDVWLLITSWKKHFCRHCLHAFITEKFFEVSY